MAGSQIHLHPKSLGGLGIPSVYEKSETKLRKYPKSSPARFFRNKSTDCSSRCPLPPTLPTAGFPTTFPVLSGPRMVHSGPHLVHPPRPPTDYCRWPQHTARQTQPRHCQCCSQVNLHYRHRYTKHHRRENGHRVCMQDKTKYQLSVLPIFVSLFISAQPNPNVCCLKPLSHHFSTIFLSLTVNATERICFHCNCIPQSA